MKGYDGEAALAARAEAARGDGGGPEQRAGMILDKRPDAEKPRASEEIVIEEISIDGMCGVY